MLTVVVIALYFVPCYVAAGRKVNNGNGIALVNLLLGWTVIGWVAALIWASTAETKAQAQLREAAYRGMAAGYYSPYPPPQQYWPPAPPPPIPAQVLVPKQSASHAAGHALGETVAKVTKRTDGPDGTIRLFPPEH